MPPAKISNSMPLDGLVSFAQWCYPTKGMLLERYDLPCFVREHLALSRQTTAIHYVNNWTIQVMMTNLRTELGGGECHVVIEQEVTLTVQYSC